MSAAGVAVVTGGARGIGRAIAARLGRAGLQLVLVDRDEAVSHVARELWAPERPALALNADLTLEGSRRDLRDVLQEMSAPLRVLVNNAGITRDARLERMDEREFLDVIRVNLAVAYELSTLLADRFGPSSAIVNVSSRAYLGNVGQFNYSASKGGLVGLTRALALRLAPDVRVNAIAPGLTATGMTAKMPGRVRDRLVAAIPLERMGAPEEIAESVAFLASPAASYITGQVLVACGGRSIAA